MSMSKHWALSKRLRLLSWKVEGSQRSVQVVNGRQKRGDKNRSATTHFLLQ